MASSKCARMWTRSQGRKLQAVDLGEMDGAAIWATVVLEVVMVTKNPLAGETIVAMDGAGRIRSVAGDTMTTGRGAPVRNVVGRTMAVVGETVNVLMYTMGIGLMQIGTGVTRHPILEKGMVGEYHMGAILEYHRGNFQDKGEYQMRVKGDLGNRRQ